MRLSNCQRVQRLQIQSYTAFRANCSACVAASASSFVTPLLREAVHAPACGIVLILSVLSVLTLISSPRGLAWTLAIIGSEAVIHQPRSAPIHGRSRTTTNKPKYK